MLTNNALVQSGVHTGALSKMEHQSVHLVNVEGAHAFFAYNSN